MLMSRPSKLQGIQTKNVESSIAIVAAKKVKSKIDAKLKTWLKDWCKNPELQIGNPRREKAVRS